MKCNVILDSFDDELQAIIISNVTTSQEIEKILNDLKREKPEEWDYEDLRMRLPLDCEFYYSWEAETIFD